MRRSVDYSQQLKEKMARGNTVHQALHDLRLDGASIGDCIASIRSLYQCQISEAKRIVESSPVWSDHIDVSDEVLRIWRETRDSHDKMI